VRNVPKIKIKREPMARDEVAEMISKAQSQRDRVLIALLYLTGARVSEVLSLRKKDIIVEENMIRIRMPARKRRERGPLIFRHILPISKTAPFIEEVLIYIQKLDDDNHLFSGYKSPMTRVRAWQIIKELNQNTFPHFFRHTRLSKLSEAGADPFQLRDWSGRKTIPWEYVERSPAKLKSLGRRLE